jgi:hypothetical protein
LQKWEYMCCDWSIDQISKSKNPEMWNAFGEQGWELVSVLRRSQEMPITQPEDGTYIGGEDSNGLLYGFFKRPTEKFWSRDELG